MEKPSLRMITIFPNSYYTIRPGIEVPRIVVEEIDHAPELEEIKKQLEFKSGQLIETIPYFTTLLSEPCIAFCDEEGKLKGLHYNAIATALWDLACRKDGVLEPGRPLRDYLVGAVIIIAGDKELLRNL